METLIPCVVQKVKRRVDSVSEVPQACGYEGQSAPSQWLWSVIDAESVTARLFSVLAFYSDFEKSEKIQTFP